MDWGYTNYVASIFLMIAISEAWDMSWIIYFKYRLFHEPKYQLMC